MQGSTFAQKEAAGPTYLPSGDPGPNNGGTNTGSSLQPSIADYENFFGPAGRDVKIDPMRAKRRQRWHLPDNLIGVNHFLTDRVDGLITDTNNSPFTGIVLPYAYLENPDAKIKWSVYSYDEAMASRTPYETSARVLTQSKTSYAGFATRHGLAIKMEVSTHMPVYT